MTEGKRGLVRRAVRTVIVLSAGIMLLQCNGTETVEPPEEARAAVGVDYEVSRERAVVRAHVEGQSASLAEAALFTLNNADWRAMLDHGRVTTDAVGRAELRADCEAAADGTIVCDCEALILYQDSDLVSRPCHPEEAAGICATGQGLLDNCDICFETVSSRTCPEGTWVSITYLGESEITIITVGEGRATVTPVTVLEYDETAPLEFEFETREWGPPVTLKAEQVESESGEVTIPYFLYTAPEANLELIAAGAEELGIELPPAGVPQPADQLPILVDPEFGLPPVLEALGWSQPNLQPWMNELSNSAFERGGILFPPFEPPDQVEQVILDFAGGQLADPRVQEAFVTAIDKKRVMEMAFPDQDVQLTARIGVDLVDANTIPHDPEKALALLDEAGYDHGQPVTVLFPEGDDEVAMAAKWIAGELSRIDIPVELTPAPEEDLSAILKKLVSAEQPVVVVLR